MDGSKFDGSTTTKCIFYKNICVHTRARYLFYTYNIPTTAHFIARNSYTIHTKIIYLFSLHNIKQEEGKTNNIRWKQTKSELSLHESNANQKKKAKKKQWYYSVLYGKYVYRTLPDLHAPTLGTRLLLFLYTLIFYAQNSQLFSHLSECIVEFGSDAVGPVIPYDNGENRTKLYDRMPSAAPSTACWNHFGNRCIIYWYMTPSHTHTHLFMYRLHILVFFFVRMP